jgi:hypothetical protein
METGEYDGIKDGEPIDERWLGEYDGIKNGEPIDERRMGTGSRATPANKKQEPPRHRAWTSQNRTCQLSLGKFA